jgi:hypothetical protein
VRSSGESDVDLPIAADASGVTALQMEYPNVCVAMFGATRNAVGAALATPILTSGVVSILSGIGAAVRVSNMIVYD